MLHYSKLKVFFPVKLKVIKLLLDFIGWITDEVGILLFVLKNLLVFGIDKVFSDVELLVWELFGSLFKIEILDESRINGDWFSKWTLLISKLETKK